MPPPKFRTLWCLVKGDPTPYYVTNIPIGYNVSQLKERIKNRIEILHDTNYDKLDLFKLTTPVTIGPARTLEQRLAEIGNIDVHLTELSPEEKVEELFPKPPSKKHLQIVVQRPEIVPSSTPRKRSRSATEADGRAAKRKELGLDAPDVHSRCSAIREAIQAMPNNLDFSNPETFTNLPFPSPTGMPPKRFECKKIAGINHFEYMGRPQFHQLKERITDIRFQKGADSIYVYGTSGSEKSHLLAALAYHLVREGQRVFYIPDCYKLLLKPEAMMWNAYHFAYNDLSDTTTETIETLIDWIKTDLNLYIIVDQVDALEYTKTDKRRKVKKRVLRWLDNLRYNHRYIFSGSADETTYRDTEMEFRFSQC